MKIHLTAILLASVLTAHAAPTQSILQNNPPKAASSIPVAASMPVASASAPIGVIDAPTIAATAYLVKDLQSNQILASKDIDKSIEPASLTKVMTAYIVFKKSQRRQAQTRTNAKSVRKSVESRRFAYVFGNEKAR